MIEFSNPVENVSSMKDNSVFFMYENKQPDGVCLWKDGQYVEAYKTPASLGNTPIKDVATVEADKTCSYMWKRSIQKWVLVGRLFIAFS